MAHLRPRTGFLGWPRPVTLGAALLALTSTAASARPLSVTLTPELPTWHDPVRLRVSGEVVTSCGPAVMHLGNVRQRFETPGMTVDVDLVQDPVRMPRHRQSSPSPRSWTSTSFCRPGPRCAYTTSPTAAWRRPS